MQTKLNKILSLLTATILVVAMAMPSLSFAANEIVTTKTSQENVEFNVSINGSSGATLDLANKSKIDVSLNVLNTGYIKEATLTVENNNYVIQNFTNQYVNKIENNVITLNQINAGEKVAMELPIKFPTLEKVNLELFDRESKITLNAVYVNEAGKEKKIEKSYSLRVKWTKDDAKASISQKLVRYLTYDTNKTMLSFEVSAGVKDNTIPATAEEINITVPKLNDKLPKNVIVTGDDQTNNYENGILTIKNENKVDENNELVWNSQRTYMVTYIYETTPVLGTLEQKSIAKITTLTGKELSAEAENNSFNVESEVGSIVELKEGGSDTLSKGYLISNLDKTENKTETEYSVDYTINVGLSDAIDKINLNEDEANFVNSDGKTIASATDKILNKKISISKDELVKILGDEGRITVLNAEGKEIGKLTSETTELDLGNTNKISLETSKPKTEGDITIKVNKAIAGDIGLDKDTIKTMASLKSKVTISGTKSNTVISSKDIEKNITLTNPTSKVGISVSADSLSTVEENKNVVISIVLKTDTIDDCLFENPTFHIKLPDEVTATRVTEAQVLYDDELKAGTISGTANTIDLTVTGKETKYASSTVTEGALIRLNTNLTLDNTAVSDTKAISVDYTNAATGETGESSQNVKIVAPSDFVTTNTVTVGDQTKTAVEDENTTINVKENASEQNVDVSQTIVNNLGKDADGVTVLGVLPSAGNKTVEGEELQSTTGATLTSPVTVEGQEDAKVYYSTNGNEDINSNSWSENYTADAKSYKITTSSAVPAKKALKVKYQAKLASNLGYDQSTSETYGVYYNNESDKGTKTNLVSAKKVTLKTKSAPSVTMSISPVDTNAGYAISENGSVTTGEYITYNVKVTNSGSEAIKNATVKMTLPVGSDQNLTDLKFVDYQEAGLSSLFYKYTTSTDTTKTLNITSLNAGESQVASFETKVVKYPSANADENTIKPAFALNYTGGEEQTIEYSNSLKAGTLSIKIAPNIDNRTFKTGDVIAYNAYVENASSSEKQNNIELKIKIPAGLEYTENQYTKEEISKIDEINKSVSYDKSSNTITCKFKDLGVASYDNLIFSLKVTQTSGEDITFDGTITSNIETTGVKSNKVVVKTVKSGTTPEQNGISLKQTTNLQNNTCYDTDSFKIYVDLKNETGNDQYILLENMIPDGLSVKSYTYAVNGKESTKNGTDYIRQEFELANGASAKFTLNVTPYKVEKGKTKNINVITTLALKNNGEVNVTSEPLVIKVNGTSDASANPITDDDEEIIGDGTYIIGGKIYNDVNNNGKEDDGEKGISNVKLRLIDAKTRETIKNADGNTCETTSGSDGTYSFTRLNKNNYIVIAEYDTSLYTVGIYQSSEANEDDNNDFISQTIDDKQVAATNIINPTKNEYNIDLALVNRNTFDLRLNKLVSKIAVTNAKNGNKVYNYDKNSAKVELSTKNVSSNTVLIEYKIQVINEGNVAGYATSIMDKIPEGLTFNSELNKTWYTKGKNAYNQTLANTLINPGETKEVTLVLTKKMTNENMGSFNNIAEIEKSYNEYSIADIDSVAGNMQDNEDDQSNAVVTILISTGRTIVQVGAITLAVLAGVGLAVYVIKKKLIK